MKALFNNLRIALLVFLLLWVNLANAEDYSFKAEVKGKGEPVILIPGLSCSGDVWQETVEVMSKQYECHVLTLPGFAGQPPLSPMPENFMTHLRDEIAQYVQEKNFTKVHLVGHSLGGTLSLAIASKYPEMAGKIFIVDGLPFLAKMVNPILTAETAEPFAKNMKQMMMNQTKEQYEAMQPQMLQSMITAEEDIATVAEWGRKSDMETIAQSMYNLYSMDLREDIASIKSPILVLGAWIGYKAYGATHDNTLSRYQEQYSKAENATVKLTDEGKHFIMWDDKPFYLSELKSFFSKGKAVN